MYKKKDYCLQEEKKFPSQIEPIKCFRIVKMVEKHCSIQTNIASGA